MKLLKRKKKERRRRKRRRRKRRRRKKRRRKRKKKKKKKKKRKKQDRRPEGLDIDVAFEGSLWGPGERFNQQEIIEAVRKHFETEKCGGILELPTSSGKTIMLLYIITQILKKKALVVSPMIPVHS